MCQSPIYRDTHFYRVAEIATAICAICVNPLSIGTPISTARIVKQNTIIVMCQSPIYRDTHFYKYAAIGGTPLVSVCQSPICRDTHFYST